MTFLFPLQAIKKVVVEFKEKKKSLRVVADEDILSSVVNNFFQ